MPPGASKGPYFCTGELGSGGISAPGGRPEGVFLHRRRCLKGPAPSAHADRVYLHGCPPGPLIGPKPHSGAGGQPGDQRASRRRPSGADQGWDRVPSPKHSSPGSLSRRGPVLGNSLREDSPTFPLSPSASGSPFPCPPSRAPSSPRRGSPARESGPPCPLVWPSPTRHAAQPSPRSPARQA